MYCTLTPHVLLVSESQACDAILRPRDHVLEEQFALLVVGQLDLVKLVERAAEAVAHGLQQPVLAGKLHLDDETIFMYPGMYVLYATHLQQILT